MGRFIKVVSRVCRLLVNISSIKAMAPWQCPSYYPYMEGQTHPLLTCTFTELTCSLLLSAAQSVSISCTSNTDSSSQCLQLGWMDGNVSVPRQERTWQEFYRATWSNQQGKTAAAEGTRFPPQNLWRLILESGSGLVLPTEYPLVAAVQYVHSWTTSLRLFSLFIRLSENIGQGQRWFTSKTHFKFEEKR